MILRKSSKEVNPTVHLKIDDRAIDRIGDDCPEKYFKFVGIRIDEHLTWQAQINHVRAKLASANFALAKIKNLLPLPARLTIYNSLFKSHLEYGLICWGGVKKSLLKPLFQIQKKCVRNVAAAQYRAHSNPIFKELSILKMHDLYEWQIASLGFKIIKKQCPQSSDSLFERLKGNRTNAFLISIPLSKKLETFPSCKVPKIWNSFITGLKSSCDFDMLKTNFKALKFSEYC